MSEIAQAVTTFALIGVLWLALEFSGLLHLVIEAPAARHAVAGGIAAAITSMLVPPPDRSRYTQFVRVARVVVGGAMTYVGGQALRALLAATVLTHVGEGATALCYLLAAILTACVFPQQDSTKRVFQGPRADKIK
jgi:hypothetical protein